MNEQREHRRPQSRRWQYGIIGACFGGLIMGFIMFAVRGPTVISINNGNDCCCCQQRQPCAAPAAPRVGDTTRGVIPQLPPGESPGEDLGTCCGQSPNLITQETPGVVTQERRYGFIPFVAPWLHSGGGSTRGGSDSGGVPESTVPVPGSIWLVAAGVAAWRIYS